MQQSIRVDEDLWRGAVAPEGILEWWFAADGAHVAEGEKLAEVRIEGARHEVMSPADGQLQVLSLTGCVLDPGAVIGTVTRKPASVGA